MFDRPGVGYGLVMAGVVVLAMAWGLIVIALCPVAYLAARWRHD